MRVIETSSDEDLAPFSRFLWQQRVAHRIFEERGQQVLELARDSHATQVRDAYAAWRRGELSLDSVVSVPDTAMAGRSRVAAAVGWLRRYPVLCLLLVVSLVVYPFSAPIGEGRLTDVANWLTIIDLHNAGTGALPWTAVLNTAQPWRWLTPIFLHFSVVHLLFNCAVIYEFGRRIEAARGSPAILLMVVAAGVVSNLGQFWWSGNPVFGGLSGLAYGLLGFVLVSARRAPAEKAWQMPKGMAISLLLFLVLFSSGITEAFGLYIANAAHWVGLIAGCVLAALWPVGNRK